MECCRLPLGPCRCLPLTCRLPLPPAATARGADPCLHPLPLPAAVCWAAGGTMESLAPPSGGEGDAARPPGASAMDAMLVDAGAEEVGDLEQQQQHWEDDVAGEEEVEEEEPSAQRSRQQASQQVGGSASAGSDGGSSPPPEGLDTYHYPSSQEQLEQQVQHDGGDYANDGDERLYEVEEEAALMGGDPYGDHSEQPQQQGSLAAAAAAAAAAHYPRPDNDGDDAGDAEDVHDALEAHEAQQQRQLNALEAVLRQADAVMEPGIMERLRGYVMANGHPQAAVEHLTDSYVGEQRWRWGCPGGRALGSAGQIAAALSRVCSELRCLLVFPRYWA